MRRIRKASTWPILFLSRPTTQKSRVGRLRERVGRRGAKGIPEDSHGPHSNKLKIKAGDNTVVEVGRASVRQEQQNVEQ